MIKASDPEWRGTRQYLETEIGKQQIQLERADLTEAQHNTTRGRIAALRQIIEHVDPKVTVPDAEPRSYNPQR